MGSGGRRAGLVDDGIPVVRQLRRISLRPVMPHARIGAAALFCVSLLRPAVIASAPQNDTLDADLSAALAAAGFTGRIEQTYRARIEATLGRPLDPKLADLGRLLWFDTLPSLHAD